MANWTKKTDEKNCEVWEITLTAGDSDSVILGLDNQKPMNIALSSTGSGGGSSGGYYGFIG